MTFNEVYAQDLETLRPGLLLLDRVMTDSDPIHSLSIFGLTTNVSVLDAARTVLQSEFDDEEEGGSAPELSEVAVAIPLSGDTLYYLLGSGLLLEHEPFAFVSPSEGARTRTLTFAGYRPRVTVGDFTTLCIQEEADDIGEFLQKYGKSQTSERVTRAPMPAVRAGLQPSCNSIDNFLAS